MDETVKAALRSWIKTFDEQAKTCAAAAKSHTCAPMASAIQEGMAAGFKQAATMLKRAKIKVTNDRAAEKRRSAKRSAGP